MGRNSLKSYRIWFITGSQHLYGEETLKQVAEHSRRIVDSLNGSGEIALDIVWKPTVKTQAEVTATLRAADVDPACAGVICWMHTFSPAKMWINGLKLLQKPMLHLNTQANRDIPWASMDMDFMNLNQAAHGDREFGYICTRLGIRRKVVNGYCDTPRVRAAIDVWSRVAAAWLDSQTMRVARIGDNMREVAVTEGNKVDAQIQFGYAVDGYGFGAEGDWKTAALLRTMKLMAAGRPGGVSFMEDYTYHFEPGRERVLGAHMLEVCPSIAAGKPSLEVHPLGIGGKADPARLVFTTAPGGAINATMVEFGADFRLVVNELEIVAPDAPLPKLPVASTVWIPKPDLAEGARRWIEAGGAHHSVNAPALTTEFMEDYARIAGVELVVIR